VIEREIRLHHAIIGLAAAAIAGAAVVAAIGRVAGFTEIGDALAGASFGWLVLCVVGQVLVFAGYSGALRGTVAVAGGPQLQVGVSVRVVLASFAATQVFAFGGLGGLALVYWVLRRLGSDARDATVRLIGLNTAVYLVFGVLAWTAAAIALLSDDAPLSMTVPWIAGLPVVIAAARWFTDPRRIDRWTGSDGAGFRGALGIGVAAAAWVRNRVTDPDGRPLFGWIACYWVGDLISLWAALQAFGAEPGVVALTAAYTTGYLVQSLPIPLVATAGVDTATTLLLHVVGVPLDLALLGVVAHRVFAFWLPVAPGAVLAVTLSRSLPERDTVTPGA
jgi:uncharacterized membrane protein YbhN (UPF0104 family)